MYARCGNDCGYDGFTVSTATATKGQNIPKAATHDYSDWGTQTQCVDPTNADDQCQWLGKGCVFKTQCQGTNVARYVHSQVGDIDAPANTTAAPTHADWAAYYWNLRCNWTTEYDSRLDAITDMHEWNSFVASNASSEKKYTADTKTAPATTATAAVKTAYADNVNHKNKYTWFVSNDTISATNPNPYAKQFLTWHAATAKAATTQADLEALRDADKKLLADANSVQTTACATPATTATAAEKTTDADNCTAAKDRVAMVQGWVDADDAALTKLNNAAKANSISKTETLKNEQAALTANEKKLKAL